MANTPTRDSIDDADEIAYWRSRYTSEPYYRQGTSFEYYEVAYRIGAQGRSRHRGRSFDDIESELREEYERTRTADSPTWDDSRDAVRAAWHRLDDLFPDSD